MTESAGASKTGRIPWILIGLLLLGTVFGGLLWLRSHRYRVYVTETLDRTEAHPWTRSQLSPVDCVHTGFEWLSACPGMKDFCRRGFRRWVETCMASQDRTAWCAAHDRPWGRTSFGKTECERLKAQTADTPIGLAVKNHCTHGYLVIATHCQRLATADPQAVAPDSRQ